MSAAINEQIDKAARMLNSMMEEIHQEAFVSGAVSEVTGAVLTVPANFDCHLFVGMSFKQSSTVAKSDPINETACYAVLIAAHGNVWKNDILCVHRAGTRSN